MHKIKKKSTCQFFIELEKPHFGRFWPQIPQDFFKEKQLRHFLSFYERFRINPSDKRTNLQKAFHMTLGPKR